MPAEKSVKKNLKNTKIPTHIFKTMILLFKKHFLYLSIVLFGAFSLSACSQQKQSGTQPEQPEVKTVTTNAEPVSVTMYKNPNCLCCGRWAAYLEENGFSVKEIPTDTLASVKKQQGVPNQLGSCHTALIEGYVVEGHVPAAAINKLLKERPDAKGIAAPGMPAQSPGMAEVPGPVEVYFFNGPDQAAYYDTF